MTPAYPRPASEYTKHGTLHDGNIAEEAQTGMTLRDYFAARAPRRIPKWFRHEPAPNKPGERPEPAPERDVGNDYDAQMNERARYNVEYNKLEEQRREWKAAMDEWNAADDRARFAQWRWAYADLMLETRG